MQNCGLSVKAFRKKGFTLIELLVVISIIALLLSILIPSLQKTKKLARSIVCKSNLKQWGVATFTYLADWDDRFFGGNVGTGDPSQDWIEAMRAYYGSQDEFRVCPSAAKISAPEGQGVNGALAWGGRSKAWGILTGAGFVDDYGSYAMNQWLCDPTDAAADGFPPELFWRKSGNVKQPSQVPLFADGMWVDTRPRAFDQPYPEPYDYDQGPIGLSWSWWNTMQVVCLDRHMKQINSGFMDGSALTVGLKELWQLHWHLQWQSELGASGLPAWPDWMRGF